MMFLKNYTSEVPVHQTIYRIEQVLIRAGVTGIAKEYTGTDGKISAITFAIKFDESRPVTIRIPVNEDAAQQALWMDYAEGEKLTPDGSAFEWSYGNRKKKKKADFREQGERTAWKLMQDWIEVQLSLIQMNQADLMQVFLPYVWDGRQTYYESLKTNGFRAMLPEKSEDSR